MSDSTPDPSDPGPVRPPAAPSAERRYERQGMLGRGGMGLVYSAHDATLRRQVALKVAATPELAGRLQREAWITGQLEHPGIVAVYDAGVTDGQAWYTMRLIRGRTLREQLASCGDLRARLALLPHVHAACQAMAYAHSMGIVHGDLKPANIMVGSFGETQVADWGLATPVDATKDGWARIVNPGGGTPAYMSPEQQQGAVASRSTDVYALGVVLRELLAPEAQGDDPPLPADAPPELVAIVRRCLHPDAERRYPDAGALAEELDRWMSGRRVEAHEYTPRELLVRLVRAWRVPLVVAGIGLVALVAAITVGAIRTRQEQQVAESNLAAALTAQSLTALREERLPEAEVLAAHAIRLGPAPEARGVLAAIGASHAELLEELEVAPACRHLGVLSPDGRRIACAGKDALEIWTVGAQASVRHDLQVSDGPVWWGNTLLVGTPEAVVTIEGGRVERRIEERGWLLLPANGGWYAMRGPDVHHTNTEGVRTLFTICPATRGTVQSLEDALVVGCNDGQVHTYGPDGQLRNRVVITDRPGINDRPAWSTLLAHDGVLRVGGLDGEVSSLDPRTGTIGTPLPGSPQAVRSLLAIPGHKELLVLGERGGPRLWNPETGVWAGALPAGVSRMYAADAPGEVWLLGDTLRRWRIVAEPRPATMSFSTGVSQAVPSPDGSRIAVALGGGEVVERRRVDGAELRRWRLGEGVVKSVVYADAETLVAGGYEGVAQVLGPGSAQAPLPGGHSVRRLGRLLDGRVWAATYGGGIHIHDLRSGTTSPTRNDAGAIDGSSSPSGATAALVDGSGAVWRLDGDTWLPLPGATSAVAVDIGDGGRPVVLGRRRAVCVDDRCEELEDDVVDVALSSRHVAVATLRGDVHLFDVRTLQRLALLRGHRARLSSVEFGPDGSWLITASWDGTVRIWELGALHTPADTLVRTAEATWRLDLKTAMGG